MRSGFFKRFLQNLCLPPGGDSGGSGGSGGSGSGQPNVYAISLTDVVNVIHASNLLGPVENLDTKYYIDNLTENVTLLLIPNEGG